jgi:hypothetical protein
MVFRSVLLALVLLAPIPASSQHNEAAEAECYALRSHAEWTECLEARAQMSAKARLDAEARLRDALEHWDEDSDEKARAKSAYLASAADFTHWRTSQCNFMASLSAGGNSAHDRVLSCEIQLDSDRAAALTAAISSLRP